VFLKLISEFRGAVANSLQSEPLQKGYRGRYMVNGRQVLPCPVLVGIEAIAPMQWFLNLLEELGIGPQ
jgi:hypothetical protein